CERSDMHLVNDLAAEFDAFPACVGPGEGAGVDRLRELMRTFGLKSRSGVGIRIAAIQAVFVQRSRARALHRARIVAVILALKFEKPGLFRIVRLNHFDLLVFRSPDSKMDTGRWYNFGSHRHA